MSSQLLEVHPRELKFAFELKKQSSCSVRLTNRTSDDVAFKVKTTSPKKYCVRPNVGIVPANSTCDFTVTMQAQKVAPDFVCKDKFLVQSTVVPAGTTDQAINSSIFTKEAGALIEEIKLRVILISTPSPVLSSGDRLLQQDFLEDVTCGDSAIQSPLERFSQKLSGQQEPVLSIDQKYSEVNDMDPKVVRKSNRREWDRSNDVKLSVMKLSPDKTAEDNEFDPSTEAYASVKDVISTHATSEQNVGIYSAVKDKICYVETSEATRTVPKTENEAVGKTFSSTYMEGRSSVKGISENVNSQTSNIVYPGPCALSLSSNSETPKLVDPITESFDEEEMVAPALPLELKNKVFKPTEELKLAQDFEKMKTKLNTLESKLNQAELIITNLTEERRMSTQERSMLKEELEQLKRARLKKVQPGFPFLFLVMVGIISAILGYFARC